MLIIFTRAVILYVALLVVMRLMGKRQIGEMQPFEFIITLLIAELACVPMTDVSIPLSYGLVSVLAVFILHQLMSLLERTGNAVKYLISGKPSVVLTPNGVNLSELKRNNMGVEDLSEAMRTLGYYRLEDLSYAIFESNGKLSALESPNRSKQTSMPLLLVENGKPVKENFPKRKITVDELLQRTNGELKKISEAEVLTLDENVKVYLQKKGEPFKIIDLKEIDDD